MKAPPENTSDEAKALRTAALAWARHEARDADDREGRRLNRVLLFAAIRYTARVVTGLPASEAALFYEGNVPSWVTFMKKNDHAFARAIRSFARVV